MSVTTPNSEPLENVQKRTQQLSRQGVDGSQAFGLAWHEHNIQNWPSAWGDDLQIVIYGDFEPPDEDLHFTSLGITVHCQPVKSTAIKSARTVRKATVRIGHKSIEDINDAARRINLLLGVWTLLTLRFDAVSERILPFTN